MLSILKTGTQTVQISSTCYQHNINLKNYQVLIREMMKNISYEKYCTKQKIFYIKQTN